MSKIMRYTLAGVVFIAWLALMAGSMSANILFGLLIAGSEGWSPAVIAAVTAASDVLKAIAPIIFLYCITKRAVWPATAALIITLVTTVYSCVAAVGFSSTMRSGFGDARIHQAITTSNVQDRLDSLKQERSYLPKSRPSSVVEADMAKAKLDPHWGWSVQCSQIGNNNRSFCTSFAELNVELASAQQRAVLDVKVGTAEQDFAKEPMIHDADPQIKVLSYLSGFGKDIVSTSLVLLFALLVEVGSACGLTIALVLLNPSRGMLADAVEAIVPKSDPLPLVSAPSASASGTAALLMAAQALRDANPTLATRRVTAADGPPSGPILDGLNSNEPIKRQIVRRFSLQPPFYAIETVEKKAANG